jgi:hypothetical protein
VAVDPLILAVTEKKIALPADQHPICYIGGEPVRLDPVWRRALQDIIDRQAAIAELLNATRDEVDTHHP